MIMNKKIFTLLAGILMLGLFAVSGNAQGRNTFLKKQDLRVGKPVRKLQAGPNKGYYYLSVDSVVGFDPTTVSSALTKLQGGRGDTISSYIPDGNNGSKKLMVLFMRPDTNKNGRYSLFVDTLNVIKRTGSRDSVKAKWKGYFKESTPKTEISASALWCVNVTDYIQGQNPTFDFTNKQYRTLLEIDAYNHESWRRDSSSSLNADRNNWRMSPAHGKTSLVPGGLSGWEFSETYATVLNAGRPLVTYLDDTHDTVAVLCMPRDTSNGHRFGELVPDSFICVKIAPATDVRAGKVDGMLYFTLREALPFALEANDFNSLSKTNPLKFSPDAASNNIFTSGLKAAQLDTNAHRSALVDVTFLQSYAAPGPTLDGNWQNPRLTDTMFVSFPDSILDYMGYMHLKSGNNYLRVDSNFHVRNAGGDQFLKFATGTEAQMWTKLRGDTVSRRDSLMYGQYVWRMVYYPSGDSVYINPFKAAYRPEYDPAIWHNGADSVRSLGWVTQQYYTFAAIPDTSVLHMQSNINAGHLGANRTTHRDLNTSAIVGRVITLDSNQVKTARLRDGFMVNALNTASATKGRAENAPLPYKYRHRLYVSIQNLASGREVTLHSNHSGFLPAGDCSINTHINFGGYYTPCLATGSDRVSIPSDLYLIRNTDGQYLHVPLYSAHDSAVWTYLDEFVHPEELPSFQWIVEKRYRNSENSPINIINREFGHRVGNKYGLAFENVELKKDMKHFSFRTDRWRWNEEKMVNERTTTFDAAKSNMSEKNGATFIALPKKYKNDPLLGYQWINPDTSIVNLYAFNYASGIDNNRYISTATNFDMNAYPKTDTCLYIGAKDNFDVAYFRMDTIGAENGKLNEYGYKVVSNKNQVEDLVTLKRQAYRLNYENPFKYCLGTLSVSNAAQHYYSLSSRLTAPLTHILGRPVFYLRDVYMENDGVKDFALVQVMDTAAMQSADSTQLKTYMTQTLGSQISDLMMRNLRIAGKFNPGLFVLAVDEPTLKLKFDYRGNSVTRVSTFRLKKDADPIYRRFNTELEGKVGDDSPRTMKFFRTSSMTTGKDYLFENTGALTDQKAYYKGPRNYLGLVSSNSNPNAKTSIFVDTAYVNRGTGYIKPQYLLMIRPSIVSDTLGCDDKDRKSVV